jgi:hypothetical protein
MAFGPTLITKGNLPVVTDALVDENGAAVNLTGAAVQFVFQRTEPNSGVNFTRTATITNAAQGLVSYQFAAGESDNVGDYNAVWRVTFVDNSVKVFPYPSGYINFTVRDVLPSLAPNNVTLIASTYELIRAILGDFNTTFRRYEDAAIQSVVRTVILSGRSDRLSGYLLTPDRLGVTPVIADPRTLGTLIYYSALMFLMPNAASYSYQTRALSERFGDQARFVMALENALYDLESGEMFSTYQSFYAWVSSLTGCDIWALMTDMKVNAPVAQVTVGRDGVQVSHS